MRERFVEPFSATEPLLDYYLKDVEVVVDEIRQSWRGGRERFHAAGLGLGATALAHLAIKRPAWHSSLALFGMEFGMRWPEGKAREYKRTEVRYATMPDADVDAFVGRVFGVHMHPAATAPMRARALAATVGPGREFAQTRLSFLAHDMFAALTNVLAYDTIRQPTILVQVRPCLARGSRGARRRRRWARRAGATHRAPPSPRARGAAAGAVSVALAPAAVARPALQPLAGRCGLSSALAGAVS